jgi:hypothetical protein
MVMWKLEHWFGMPIGTALSENKPNILVQKLSIFFVPAVHTYIKTADT